MITWFSSEKNRQQRQQRDGDVIEKKKQLSVGGNDTIAAVITPPGTGGIAALRVAGPGSRRLLKKFFVPKAKSTIQPFLLRYGHFVSASGSVLDEVTAVFMPKGKSYTGLDQVEIFCHGGGQVVRRILQELISGGARPAEPGEFTKIAFLNGRIDLAKAEAVAELIAADTESSFEAGREHLLGAYSELVERLRSMLISVLAEIEASIDFTEEEIDPATNQQLLEILDDVIRGISVLRDSYTGGRIIREGFRIAICGRPNAGKSSLFNLLLKQERALVNPQAGTTRDYLSEWIDLGGYAVNLIDTAGLRQTGSGLERQGQEATSRIIKKVDLVLWMFDLAQRGWQAQLKADLMLLGHEHILLLGNKIDLLYQEVQIPRNLGWQTHHLSCLTGVGVKKLPKLIIAHINETVPAGSSGLVVTSARHKQKLSLALRQTRRARKMMTREETPDIIAFELRQAAEALAEITGKVYNEKILERIFSRFCVGK